MNRRVMSIVLTLFILVVVAMVIGNCASNINTIRATQEPRGGCTDCHVKLSEEVPESHFKVTLEEEKYCLICHSLEGPAAAFDWVIHLGHYSTPGFVGNCWSCHLIDEGGSFRLIEAADGKGIIKATEDVVEQMCLYFQSWSTSEHLDHWHAQRSVTCGLCHGTFFPEERVSMDQCLRCHGSYEHLAALTKNVDPNPHNSHHGEMRCALCHSAHEESVLYCNMCHVFDLEVP